MGVLEPFQLQGVVEVVLCVNCGRGWWERLLGAGRCMVLVSVEFGLGVVGIML